MAKTMHQSDSVFQRVDLSLLKHFYAIAGFGGFSRASRATGISQPALSLGLQKLEKLLGAKLIDRKVGKFSLTEPGRVLQSYCKRLEGTLESMLEDLGGETLSAPKRLRIGTALSVGYGPLVRMCVEAARSSPAFELELSAHNTYHLLTGVSEGALDAAVVPDDVYDRRVSVSPLLRDKLVFVHAPGHSPALSTRAWLSRNIDTVLVTYPRETPMRSMVDKLCGKHELRFRAVISVNGLDAITKLVRWGVGGAFVLRSLVLDELRNKELQEARPPFDLPLAGFALATAQGEHGDQVANLLKSWLPAI